MKLKGLNYFLLSLLLIITGVLLLSFTYTKNITIPNRLDGKHVEVEGVKLRVLQTGEGPDVLFLHGSIGSLEDFEPVLSLIKNYRVITFDRIGHGYSELPSVPANIQSNAHYASALIENLQLKDVIIVGHSYGGSIALKMAINQDPNIKALVLIAPASKPSTTRAIEHLFSNKYIGKGLLRILRPVIAEDMLREGLMTSLLPNQDSVPAGFIESRLTMWNETGILFTRTQQTAVVNQELSDMLPQYATIKVPVIVLLGEQEAHEDIYEGSQELSVAIPGAQLQLVTGAGHYLQYREPAAIAQAISAIPCQVFKRMQLV